MSDKVESHLKQINYEIFIIILTMLSWVNTIFYFMLAGDIDAQYIIVWIECLLSIILLFDFLYRLRKAKNRSLYFKKIGWLDLIGSLPFLQWFRAYRVYLTTRYIRGSRGRVFRQFFKARAETAVLTVSLAVIFLFEFASIFILRAEEFAPNANIITAGDAVWWVLVTVATVGYGDMYPVTENGRLIATLVIIAGVGLFGILTGFLAQNFLGGQTTNTSNEKETGDTDSQLDQILTELKEIQSVQAQTRTEQDAATQQLQERLATVEELLKAQERNK